MQIVKQSQLPERELEGTDHGAGVSIILVHAQPGRGPALHKHAYEEVFIVQEGRATFTAGDEEREVSAGAIVIVPATLLTGSSTRATGRSARSRST